MKLTEEIRAYIQLHREEDVRSLALKRGSFPPEHHQFVIQQISGWQTAKEKVPSWAATEEVLYPVHLSLEQCSSELTAQFKASLMVQGESFADLTGGMGVDFSFLSRQFKKSLYVEQNPELCELAEHNFKELQLSGFQVLNTTFEQFLPQMSPVDVVYLDPARRDSAGRKVVSISDCSPNLCDWKNQLLAKSHDVWVKYSPMLDISLAVSELEDVSELFVISVQNECKELLFHLTRERSDDLQIICVDLKKSGERSFFKFAKSEEPNSPLHLAEAVGRYLYEPNSSLMKAGAFKILTEKFPLKKLAVSSHLYTSDEKVEDFPGRCFEVEADFSLSKNEVKELLSDCVKANMSVRNFPMSVEQLRKKLKIADGGDVYLFATTIGEKKKIVKCKKIEEK
jgi:16S rRNA G966 N2-methylase RsmD